MTTPARASLYARRRPPASPGPVAGPPAARRVPGWLGLAVLSLTALAGLLLFLLPLGWVRIGSMNGLGLFSVLPVASLAGLALLVLAFAGLLALRRPVPVALGVMLVAIIFCLDGVTAVVEPLPRFATSYQVYGFVNYISRTGHVAPGVTAYFSWPGFFALVALARRAAGVHSLLPLLTWWPVIIDTLIVAPFLLLTRALRISWRARWLAALLLCLGNWVGQDYFSPQSFNFLLYLVVIAILLTWFSGRRQQAPLQQGGPKRISGERPAVPVGSAPRAILLLLVIGIFVASVISHQLTPFLIIAACAGLVIVGRCTPRGLPILLAVIAIGWVSFATAGYWSGHMSTIFGQIGRLGGTISASVGSHLIGTPTHQFPVYGRIVLAGIVIGLAVLGLLRRWHRRVTDRALVILLIAPASIAALQNYGGEISLRIFLFALPAAAILAACLFFPETGAGEAGEVEAGAGGAVPVEAVAGGAVPVEAGAGGAGPVEAGAAPDAVTGRRASEPRSHRRVVLAAAASGLVAVSLAGLFMLTRYGNEGFEQIPRGELKAMNYIYAHQRGGTAVLWLSRPSGINATPQMPWQFRDTASVRFVSLTAPRNPEDTAQVVADLNRLGRGAYLITTKTEATFIRQTASYDPAWERSFRAAMAAEPGVQVVVSNRDAAVYRARLPATAPRARSELHAAAAYSGATFWTPIGLAVLLLSVVLLASRELIRECLPGRRWLMRPLALACIPAVTLLLIAVVERFRVIS